MSKKKKEEPSFQQLFEFHLQNMRAVVAKSNIALELLSNISESGASPERWVRTILSQMLPKRFKVTCGYIASCEPNQQPTVSPQADVLVVDTLVPHCVFDLQDIGIELVYSEAVVGIFEIKKTLTKQTLKDALLHLHKIFSAAKLTRNNSIGYFPGGVSVQELVPNVFLQKEGDFDNKVHARSLFCSEALLYNNPMVGVIALKKEASLSLSDELENQKNQDNFPHPDAVLCFEGGFAATQALDGTNCVQNHLYKPTLPLNYIQYPEKNSSEFSLSHALGFIVQYIQGCSGKRFKIDYFLNSELVEKVIRG